MNDSLTLNKTVADEVEDLFVSLDLGSRLLVAAGWAAAELVGLPTVLVTVWYETNESQTYHTLVNMLNVAALSAVAAFSVTRVNLMAARVLLDRPLGPLPCGLQVGAGIVFGFFSALSVMELNVVRHLFKYEYVNPAFVHDKLVFVFLICFNLMLCLFYGVSVALVKEAAATGSLYEVVCRGIRPADSVSIGHLSRPTFVIYFLFVCFIGVILLLNLRTLWKRFLKPFLTDSAQEVGPIAAAAAPLPAAPNQGLSLSATLINHTTLSTLAVPFVLVLLWQGDIRSRLVDGKYSEVSDLELILALLLGHLIPTFFLPCLVFLRHHKMRRYVARNVAGWLGDEDAVRAAVRRLFCVGGQVAPAAGAAMAVQGQHVEEIEMNHVHM